jgi:hypothetical protein
MKKSDKIFKKRLEKILIDSGLINNEIADHIRSIEAETGKLLGDILVEEGYVTEEDIARELSRNLQLPYLSLENYNVSKKLVESIPAQILHKHQVIPIDRFGNTLSIAMSQHLTLDGFKELQEKLDNDVTFFVGMIGQVRDLLKEFAPIDESEIENLRKQKTDRPKASSWTDIFDTANKSTATPGAPGAPGAKEKSKRRSVGLDIFDTGNTKVMRNLNPSKPAREPEPAPSEPEPQKSEENPEPKPKKKSGGGLDIFDMADKKRKSDTQKREADG